MAAGTDLFASSAGLDATQTVAGTDLFADPNAPGPFKKGLKAGSKGQKATAGGALALVGDIIGSDSVKQYGLDVSRNAQKEAGEFGMRVEDVHDFSSAVDFAKYGAGYLVPQLATAVAAGLIGRIGGAGIARGLATPAAGLLARNAGMTAGLATSSIAQEAGSIYPDAVDAGLPDAAARAIVGGTLAGSLDLVPELLAAKMLGVFGKKVLNPAHGLNEILKGGAKAALGGAALEAGTEGAQTVIERASADQDITSPEGVSDIVNSAVLGAIGGGLVGGPVGAISAATGQAPAVAPAPAPAAIPEPAPAPAPAPAPEEPAAAPAASPFASFPADALRTVTAPDQLALVGGPGTEPIVPPLEKIAGDIQATKDRIAALSVELKGPAKEGRSKQAIAQERKALEADLVKLTQHESNTRTLLETPEYQEKGSLATPTILGEQPQTPSGKPIITPQEDEMLRLAEQEAINAARQGSFKGSIQPQRSEGALSGQAAGSGAGNRVLSEAQVRRQRSESSVETQLGLIKRSRGLLLTADEAKGVREFEKTTPQIATPTGGGPRATVRQLQPRDRQEAFANAYSRGVDSILGDFQKAGVFTPEKATSVGTALKRAVENALAKPNAEEASDHFNEAFDKALKNKLPPEDIETFRAALTTQVKAALPTEPAQPGDQPVRSVKVEPRAGVPDTAEQQTLFNRGAKQGTIQFTHWGKVQGGFTNPASMGTGVKGADWAPARAVGLSYTSAVVKGSPYREPAVQAFPQYEGALRSDKVYIARSDDPLLQQARQEIAEQHGPNEQIAWMEYAKKVRDLGYDAMMYAGGQLRIFTPQQVQAANKSVFEDVLPALPEQLINQRAKEVVARHAQNGGSSTYLKTGQDAAGMSAYSVSMFKQRELAILGHPNAPTVAAYIRANDDLLSQDGYLLGTWFNADDGKTYLDISLAVPDMKAALRIAREHNQLAIFDLRTLTTISLGHPLFDVAQEYNAANGLPPVQELEYIDYPAGAGRRIADAYDTLLDVNPDPRVKTAFEAMAKEEEQMFDMLSKSVKIEPWTKDGQPYKSSAEMRADVFGNNHLYVFQGGEPHPYRTPEQIYKGRAVHDLLGHARTGFEFGARGELNATRAHAQMYSETALPALVIDNIGQNAWVNFSRANDGLPADKRAYAAQKVDFLPEALWRPLLTDATASRAAAVSRFERVMQDKGEHVLNYLEHVLGTPKELEVRLVEDIAGGVGALRLSKAKALIELSMSAKDIYSVAAHEGYHYIESRVFSGPERRIMRQAFANGTPLFKQVLDAVRKYDKENGTNLAEEVEKVPAEARAYAFEFWRRGDIQVTGPVQRMFAAIRKLIERISNYVNGLGFTSYEDIFNGIERGDYARRELQGLRSGTLEQSYIESIEPDALPVPVLHRDRKAASQAKGRPGWIKTPADLAKMRKLLKGLTVEGAEAKDWYRRSAQAMLKWADGDQQKAGKLAALVAMYSPRTPVGQDLRRALQHYAQWEAGQKINAGGTKHQSEYGSRILDGTGHRDYLDKYTLPGNPESAPKITSFFKNLMQVIDPVTYPPESQDATIDMWMSHVFGFGSKDGKLNDSNYWWADAEIKRLSNELQLAPDQVQAAVWVAIKARGNMTRALARKQGIEAGWFSRSLAAKNERSDLFGQGGRPTVYKLKPKHEFDYMVNWIRLSLTVPFSKANFDAANFSYAEAFRDVSDGTLPLSRLDFDFEIQAGLFDDIAFGKVSQGELTFYSRAASISEVAQRVRNGELPRQQLNALWAEAVDGTEAAGLRESIQRPAFAEAKGALGSFKRFYSENLSSGLNLARHSAGFKNVFNVLTAYTQRKNRLIADAVERGLSEWTGKGAGTQSDKIEVSKALLKRTENSWSRTSPELRNLRESLTEKQRAMFDQATKMIADQLDAELRADVSSYRTMFSNDEQFNQWYQDRAGQVERLKNEGYFPERRYGDHVVHAYVEGEGGKRITVYYSQHEREADARSELAELTQLLPDQGLKFEYGYRYRADYDASLSFAQFLDLAARHGVKLTQAEKERIGKALIAADSTRRNRIFRRKNIAGFSEDGMRVLAEFGVTMANKVAYSELGRAMNDAVAGHEVDVKFTPTGDLEINTHDNNVWALDGEKAGFYRNIADQTVDFVMSPRQGSKLSRGLRLASTAQFLGGSAAAAVVQLTSLPMNTVPWLTQYTDYTNAFIRVADGSRLAAKHLRTIKDLPSLLDQNVRMEGIDEVDGLRRALQIAAQDGTILDTEIYQIMGLSRGQEYSFSGRTQQAIRAWMLPFRLSEQFNRVSTFVAAYKVAKEKNMSDDAAYKLAQDTVYSTQFRYDEANRPALARGDVGSLLFVFKSYPIYATELITYLAKEKPQAAVYMLLSFLFMSGVEGLPFAEDIEDLIDTIAQRIFGSSFNSKRALHNVLKTASEAVTGVDLSSVFMHGVANELTGLSFASRVGLGNLIPGTRIGTADADYKQVMNEALGPIGSLIQGSLAGVDSMTRGQWLAAAKQVLPLAGQNLIKGWEQWEKGFATDLGGRKLVDVDGYQAFWQGLGFSSSALVKAYDAQRIDKQTAAFYTRAKQDIMGNLVKAIRDGKTDDVAAATQAIYDWNRENPSMPIAVSPASVRRQVQLSSIPLNERTLRTLPRALRANSENALGLEDAQ